MSILRRLWPRRIYAQPLLRAPAHPYALLTPIPLAKQEPVPNDADADGLIWFGKWVSEWRLRDWTLSYVASSMDTHWLPASVEVLPARCCPPEVG